MEDTVFQNFGIPSLSHATFPSLEEKIAEFSVNISLLEKGDPYRN